ncbi:MAG TPA: hypothetical protein VJQ46_01965 [Gemmatimonadales bacterium]|nr:hypothetical protein [Gemmatimonadales bacterium]
MTGRTRRVLEMLVRVLNWLAAYPDEEPGGAVLVAQLRALVARMTQVINNQRGGQIASRSAAVRKQELRRAMLSGPIVHLAEVGRLAASEVHELRSLFAFKPTAGTLLAFQSAARGMYAAAQEHKEVLVKHGLSESVLVQFGRWLDEFDAAVTLGAQGRTMHTAATRELYALTKEAGRVVRAMDARNRLRFQEDRQALELWVSARTVLGSPTGAAKAEEPSVEAPDSGGTQGGTPDAGGDVRPAA